MAVKCELSFFTLCLFFACGYSTQYMLKLKPSTRFSPRWIPRIDGDLEYKIIEANNNDTVSCTANFPIKWTTPYDPDPNPWTTFVTEDEGKGNKYRSILHIRNFTYPFVGFYYCDYKDANIAVINGVTSIYLYVNDKDHLAVNEQVQKSSAIPKTYATQFGEAIIPCRPTSPDVNVTIIYTNGDLVNFNMSNTKTIYRYDPMYGFLTNDTKEVKMDIFTCIFTRKNQSESKYIKLVVEQSVSHLNKLLLTDTKEGHTVEGETLELNCVITAVNSVEFHWITPKGPIDQLRMKTNDKRLRKTKFLQKLTIKQARTTDRGTYSCIVTDRQGHSEMASLYVNVFDVNESFINTSQTDKYITVHAGEPYIRWRINIEAHPVPTVTWFRNDTDSVPLNNGTKYEMYYNVRENVTYFRIKNVSITDLGYYNILVNNSETKNELCVFLNVLASPTLLIETQPLYPINSNGTAKCVVHANPEPKISWEHKDCQTDDCHFVKIPPVKNIKGAHPYEFISYTPIDTSRSGSVRCSAANVKGRNQTSKNFYITDVKDGFDIFGLDSNVNFDEKTMTAVAARGDAVQVTCGASVYNYSDVSWFFNDKIVNNSNRYTISRSNTMFSERIQLEIPKADFLDNGSYSCRVRRKNGEYLFKNITFYMANAVAPFINRTNMRDKMEMNIPDKLTLFCEVSGIPKPTTTWFKNGQPFAPSEPSRITFSESNERVTFKYTDAKDEGTYKCEVRNRMGVASQQQEVIFKNLLRNQKWLIYVIVLISLLFVAAVVFIVIKIRKERLLQRELKNFGLANFEKGAVENINPELGIDDQAELLPYDKKWEFPIENLKLGKQLGSGAFGVVLKGEAKNLTDEEPVTTVAVKMVKKNADHTYVRALASELKIMVHLGKHLNIVNLLGACTKNVAKRELLVMVEYCRFGNLQNYLLRHRDLFVDQVDPKTSKIDYTIGQEYFNRTYSVSSDRSNPHSPALTYAALAFSDSTSRSVLPSSNSMGDYRKHSYSVEASGATVMTTIPENEGVLLSNNSVQPEWRSNYRGDYKCNVSAICTRDLLAWAFQVARGMEYLASRKVLHGDLAARNILLADDNIVKICDFGLAKSMYKNDNYKKKGNSLMPLKWMAIESIGDRIFSTQSDVWSFGIVLWEFFSLGKSPYPGMEANETLYQKLLDGYRMESPENAPKEIYAMMTNCWAPKPIARPSFTKLAERIGDLLDDSLKEYYISQNDPYLSMNTERLKSGKSDYLAMLSPPTFEALSSPHYVNGDVGQIPSEDDGYLSMHPSALFSPRAENDTVFDFNVNKKQSEDDSATELSPMLLKNGESNGDSPLQSPTTPTSYSNPSNPSKTKDGTTNGTNIVKCADNYVNMPENKTLLRDNKAVPKNSIKSVDNGNRSSQYVNSTTRDWQSIKL